MEAFLLLVGPFAIVVTKLVDLLKRAVDPNQERVPVFIWTLAGLLMGVGVALLWQLDYTDIIVGLPESIGRLEGVWGQVFTGLGIGAVAAGWHEVFKVLSSTALNQQMKATSIKPTVKAR